MTTTTNPPRSPLTPGKPAESADGPRRGPIGRIIAGSLATGLLGAVLCTLVVFAGAAEHVITGSALLAFAFGWAMLAVLSTRLTSQPQRWALVPAALMAVTGLPRAGLTSRRSRGPRAAAVVAGLVPSRPS